MFRAIVEIEYMTQEVPYKLYKLIGKDRPGKPPSEIFEKLH